MSPRVQTESSLVQRWRQIEEPDSADDNSASDQRYRRLKEAWFIDAFAFLDRLPQNSHCWCSHSDVTLPLLEPFHNYFRSPESSPIRILWKRMSSELRHCISCVVQYYKVKDFYKSEFVEEVVSPILAVLQALDKGRVASHMREIVQNAKSKSGDDSQEVICVLFEVLTYPELLEDLLVNEAFIPFIQYVSRTHDLQLSQSQRYPGLYALLFHSSQEVRRIALGLASSLEPFNNAEELEPVQPILEKRMKYMESTLATNSDVGVLKVGITHESVWIGLQTVLGFLKAPAFEEVVERYPSLVSIVLNHVSENTSVFWNALRCLKLLLEVLGYKLWLKSAFSPGVLRNTLLSQCFHAREEKTHKAIFDLFQPFLHSLEAIQDGQYERQRGYLLYFLLLQVPYSSNFSSLIRKNASQISFGMVARSYKMDPPSPPFECAHFWGPPLISTLKDIQLHPSVRQPALDLVGVILVSDATALAALYSKSQACKHSVMDECDEVVANGGTSWFAWQSFSEQVRAECENWSCICLIWIEVLERTTPSTLSSSVTEAFIWAASRVSVIDRNCWIPEGDLLVMENNCAWSEKIAASLHWEKPKGCDDGRDGKGCSNAVKADARLFELISLFKRSADAFAGNMRQCGLLQDWSWDPIMAESVLLLLVDSSSVLRKLARDILQLFTKSNSLDAGIEFLCRGQDSLLSLNRGFIHATKLLIVTPFHQCWSLQHLFFIASKLFSLGQRLGPQGLGMADSGRSWKTFCQKLARVLWPLLLKAVSQGKQYATVNAYEMGCTRMFELLPVIFKYMIPARGNDTRQFDEFWEVSTEADCPSWFQELVGWGDLSSITIHRRWNEAVVSILEDLARGPLSSQARSSKAVDILLQPGSVIDKDQRERLVLLFSSPSSGTVESSDGIPALGNLQPLDINIIDLDDEADLAGYSEETKEVHAQKFYADSMGSQKSVADIEREQKLPSAQHKRPVSVRKIPAGDKPTLDMFFKKGASYGKETQIDLRSRKHPVKNSSKLGSLRAELQIILQHRSTSEVVVRNHVKEKAQMERTTEESLVEERTTGESLVDVPVQGSDNDKAILSELVREDGSDSLDASLDKRQRTSLATAVVHPKRKLVRLEMPGEQMKGPLPTRFKTRVQRPPPPKPDEWLMRILCLDFFSLDESKPGSQSVSFEPLVKVPMSFRSAEHYLEVFRPLLLEEFKSQLQRVHQVIDLEDVMTVGIVRLMSLERVDNLQLGRFVSEPGKDGAARACLENDLLLLSKEPFEKGSENVHMLAKVERREREHKTPGIILMVKLYLPPTDSRLNKAKRLLHDRSKWHITRLMSITPQLREFQAISAMASSPLSEIIICPAAAKNDNNKSRSFPEALWTKLKEDYNESQLAAIEASLEEHTNDSHQISLVQGPPGTGKTRTIVAIISALLQTSRSHESDDVLGNRSSYNNGKISYQTAIARSWQDAALAKQIEREQDIKKCRRARVLVCAQSNAAVDELVARICKNGLYNSSGRFYKPTIVRAGNANSVHADSMPFFIDTLVEKRLAGEKSNELDVSDPNAENTTASLKTKLEEVIEKINKLAVESSGGVDDRHEEIAKLNRQRKCLTTELQKSENNARKSIEADKNRRRRIKNEIIREAEVVLTTLSGCGGDTYAACIESIGHDKNAQTTDVFFDAVVIDEAAQALEPATLIPLQLLTDTHGRCIMIGDPKQLPATVLSQAASKMSFERSMFERFQSNGFPVTMLSVQYRMHPEIRKFPSSHFYDNQLIDGSNVLGDNRLAPFHSDRIFGPYMFLDVVQGQEKSGGSMQSVSNFEEAEVAVELFRSFKARYPREVLPGRAGIITPYKQQQNLLREKFGKAFGRNVSSDIEFNTIDGFQGREVDILILSTVRASPGAGSESKSIGFVADIRRMNVALTRARFSLWIIGNAKALRTNPAWFALLEDASERGLISPVQKPYRRVFNGPSTLETVAAVPESRNYTTVWEKQGTAEVQKDELTKRKRYSEPSTTQLPEDIENKRQKLDAIKGISGARCNKESQHASTGQGNEKLDDGLGTIGKKAVTDFKKNKMVHDGKHGRGTVEQCDVQKKKVDDCSWRNKEPHEQGTAVLNNRMLDNRKHDLGTRQRKESDGHAIGVQTGKLPDDSKRNQGIKELQGYKASHRHSSGIKILDDGKQSRVVNGPKDSRKHAAHVDTSSKVNNDKRNQGNSGFKETQRPVAAQTRPIGNRGIDVDERRRRREEAAAMMPSGSLLESRKEIPGRKTHQERRPAAPKTEAQLQAEWVQFEKALGGKD